MAKARQQTKRTRKGTRKGPSSARAGGAAGAAPGAQAEAPRKERKIRFSPDEWAAVEANAERADLAPAVFVRLAALGVHVPARVQRSEVNDEAVRELNRIGVNLNQLARWANQEGRLPEYRALQHVLSQVLGAIERL